MGVIKSTVSSIRMVGNKDLRSDCHHGSAMWILSQSRNLADDFKTGGVPSHETNSCISMSVFLVSYNHILQATLRNSNQSGMVRGGSTPRLHSSVWESLLCARALAFLSSSSCDLFFSFQMGSRVIPAARHFLGGLTPIAAQRLQTLLPLLNHLS